MNTLSSKANESNRFIYQFTDKLNLKNIKPEYNSNKFEIHAPNWNDEFNLPDGYYNIEQIQDYLKCITEKHETIADNPPVQIYVNKIKNRIVFKIKTGY